MTKIKTLLVAAVFVTFGTSLFAVDATVTFVSGKVEVQRNGKWVALQKGDTVAKSETISTGFQSEAKIKLMDSVMYLGPVTRITLEELSTVDQTDNVNVYLKTGTTRSQVKHVDNKRVNYQVHTAVAVASCRGTGWIADDSNTFIGTEGEFAMDNYDSNNPGDFNNMNGKLIRAGQIGQINGNGTANVLNEVERNAANITSTNSTAGAREAEGGTGLVDTSSPDVIDLSDAIIEETDAETASVVVSIEIPE